MRLQNACFPCSKSKEKVSHRHVYTFKKKETSENRHIRHVHITDGNKIWPNMRSFEKESLHTYVNDGVDGFQRICVYKTVMYWIRKRIVN